MTFALCAVMVGFGLITVGLVLLVGPWALVGAGVVAVAAGLLVDWEAVTHGEPAAPPPR